MYSSKGIEKAVSTPGKGGKKKAALAEATLERLKAPFGRDESIELAEHQNARAVRALVRLEVPAKRIWDRLDEVLGVSGYVDTYQVVDVASNVVLCRLIIGNAERTGIASRDTIEEAQDAAFKKAALRFGVGRVEHEVGSYAVEFTSHIIEREEWAEEEIPWLNPDS